MTKARIPLIYSVPSELVQLHYTRQPMKGGCLLSRIPSLRISRPVARADPHLLAVQT